jgi:hypothetical protein
MRTHWLWPMQEDGVERGKGEVSFAFQRKIAEIICNALTTNEFLIFFQKSQFGPSIILSILQWNVKAFRAIFLTCSL